MTETYIIYILTVTILVKPRQNQNARKDAAQLKSEEHIDALKRVIEN